METSETRDSRPLTALRNMTALYESVPSCSHHCEETLRSVVSQEMSFTSTTPHSINDILARSTRPLSYMAPQASAGRTCLPASQTNVVVTKTPILRLASPIGLAVPAAAGIASPSMYWAAAAAASLISPSLCWNQRGKCMTIESSKNNNETSVRAA